MKKPLKDHLFVFVNPTEKSATEMPSSFETGFMKSYRFSYMVSQEKSGKIKMLIINDLNHSS